MTTTHPLHAHATPTEESFRLIVAAHIDLVYSAALRQLRDPSLAQDVTQLVFITLARKLHSLKTTAPLDAWLLAVTRNLAANTRRQNARRLRHEQKAAAMTPTFTHPPEPSEWENLAPLLDDALAQLHAFDRNLIILRFMRNLPLHDVGLACGISENTAGKRITRTLEKLRLILTRKNLSLTPAALSTTLLTHSIIPAPATLAPTIARAAILAAQSTTLTLGGTLLMATTKTKITAALLIALLLAAIAIPLTLHLLPASSPTPPAPLTTAPPTPAPESQSPPSTLTASSSTIPIAPDELAGRILDNAGNPVANATVSIPWFNPMPRYLPTGRKDRIPPTTTDSNGIFRFPHFPDTWYNFIQIDKPGFSPRWITDITPGQALDIHIDNSTHLTGTVLLPSNSPASQTTLIAFTSRKTHLPNHGPTISDLQVLATSDDHGHFDIPLEPGDYDLQVTASPLSTGLFARIPIHLSLGQTLTQTITLSPGIPIRIRAVDTVTGIPIPKVELAIEKRFPFVSCDEPATTRTTDPDGIAEWTSVMPGEQHIQVYSKAYTRWTSPQTQDQDARQIGFLRANITPDFPEISLQMEPAMHLAGKVLDSTGNPVPNIYVNIHGLSTGDYRYAQRTNTNGEFDLYVPASLPAPGARCRLVVLSSLSVANPPVLASSEKFPLTTGGSKSFTLTLNTPVPNLQP